MLGTLAAGILIAGLIHKSYVLSNQMELAKRARLRRLKEQTSKRQSTKKRPFSLTGSKPSPATARQLQTVRTPWGWPQHGQPSKQKPGHAEMSHSLRGLTDRLMNPKKTKEDQEYLEKRNASIRALLEDRYGRASRMKEMPYQKVKAPLLRDPSRPYDQLDSMPSSKADQVVSKLSRQSGAAKAIRLSASKLNQAAEGTHVKTPWGW
jgi:hypothetical protein